MGEIDIDIGNFIALFGKKTFEQEFHADGIDRRDAERVTHRGIRSRSAPLRENAQTFRRMRDIPDDEKIARQIHARDDAELVLELPLHFDRDRIAVALACAAEHERAQVRMRAALTRRNRKERKLSREFFETEAAAFGDLERRADRFGIRREDASHLRRVFEIEFAIG